MMILFSAIQLAQSCFIPDELETNRFAMMSVEHDQMLYQQYYGGGLEQRQKIGCCTMLRIKF